MIVRYIKTMRPEDILRITEARTKTEAFSTALNLDFLYEALNLPERKLIESENSFFSPYDRTILSENLGIIPPPAYLFVQTFKQMGYKVFEKISCPDLTSTMTLEISLINLLGKNFAKADLLLMVGEKNHFSPLELQFGFLKDPLQSKESVLSFVNYFYNRKELYFKVFETLSKNKEKLKKYTPKPFLKALLGLFSIKAFTPEAPDFDIPTATKVKFIVPGAEDFFEPGAAVKELLGFYNPGRGLLESVKLLLLENNELAIDFYLFDEMMLEEEKILTPAIMEIVKKNPLFDKFIAENLNIWLKNIMLLTDFEEKVYNKIRTKILLNSI